VATRVCRFGMGGFGESFPELGLGFNESGDIGEVFDLLALPLAGLSKLGAWNALGDS